jgi:carbamoyltransferase
MKILGISAFYHDSAATLVVDGNIMAAAQEERFSRIKHDASFPSRSIKTCLDIAGIKSDELDYIAFYDKPFLKFERLLETYYAFAPKGFESFRRSMPLWFKEKLFLKSEIKAGIKKIHGFDASKTKLLFPSHHLSHAASAFYPSPFQRAAILTIDGVGEWATASICLGDGNQITTLRELRFPHSLGLLYSAFTYFLGFEVNGGEYKLMGLAPYGNPNSPEVSRFEQIILDNLVSVSKDGSLFLNQQFFRYATGLRMVNDRQWEKLFGFPRRRPEDSLEEHHCNLGLAIQKITERIVLAMAQTAQELTDADHICLAGGVALNCVANGRLEESRLFKSIFVQPAAGDAGGSLGAALAAWHIHLGNARMSGSSDKLSGSLLGPQFTNFEVEAMAQKHGAVYTYHSDFRMLAAEVANRIAEGNVVGWFQGRMEFGPRALGNRSILADPRNPEMQKTLNLKIKFRESFRPFAPAVLKAHQEAYFNMKQDSPYMLMVHPVVEEKRIPFPEPETPASIFQKLYHLRSDVPAITHVDYSARVQTVDGTVNPRFESLIHAFHDLTGCPMLVNTSFNVKDEPIVCTPEDAYSCFMKTGMDALVINDYLFIKSQQPPWVHE